MIRQTLLALLLSMLSLTALAQPMAPGAPREGVDFVTLPEPIPTFGRGKIEVAEVFSYGCIHCAEFQPLVNQWKKTMPADARLEYVPAPFGGVFDQFAKAFFAAQILGIQEKTHDAVFKGVFKDGLVKKGTADEIADMYAQFGADRARFRSTMDSEAVKKRMAKASEFVRRSGTDGTPTLIINGKYRILGRKDTGFPGMFKTAGFLIAQERAAQKP